MTDGMNRTEAETYLRELAERAGDIVGTHIRGITLGHDDLRKLAESVKVLLGDEGK